MLLPRKTIAFTMQYDSFFFSLVYQQITKANFPATKDGKNRPPSLHESLQAWKARQQSSTQATPKRLR